MPTPIVITDLALPRIRLMELVAASATFRTVVGAADSTEAMTHILSPYANDELQDAVDEFAVPILDTAGNPVRVLTEPMPRCIINHVPNFTRRKYGTAFGGSNGALLMYFEFLPSAEIADDRNLQLAHFEDLIGLIMQELEARQDTDKLTGEDVFTNGESPASTHFNIEEWSVVAGPGESIPQEEGGELFYAVGILVTFVG